MPCAQRAGVVLSESEKPLSEAIFSKMFSVFSKFGIVSKQSKAKQSKAK